MEILFWFVAALLAIWASFLVESDNLLKSIFGSLAIVGVIAWSANYFYGFWAAFAAFVAANPFVVALLVFGYFIIGAAYVAFWRYQSHLEDHSDDINDNFKEFKRRELENSKDRKTGEIRNPRTEAELKEQFFDSSAHVREYGPMANKTRITNWILWWPLSALYHITYRPVRAITNRIYNMLTNRLVSVFRNSSRNILK